jgi:N-acetylglutamate synthase-like GNAT family acetyltransferase
MENVQLRRAMPLDITDIVTVIQQTYTEIGLLESCDVTQQELNEYIHRPPHNGQTFAERQRTYYLDLIQSSRQSAHCFVAEVGQQIIGVCAVSLQSHFEATRDSTIEGLYVLPGARTGRIGDALLQKSEAAVSSRRIKIQLPAQSPAIGFFARRGYEPTHRNVDRLHPQLLGRYFLPQIELAKTSQRHVAIV